LSGAGGGQRGHGNKDSNEHDRRIVAAVAPAFGEGL
jgi:hypothetical protein